ncbi:MAG: cytidine deaminase [Lachnospiraceae bacterium]|nr:cytidine deaminase [Lachnospiraceae bacterium]
MDKRVIRRLCGKALDARQAAYAPYSGFLVGAALLTADGTVYTGCKIENASYSPSNCAERTAFFKAVSEGEKDFTAIAIAGGAKEAKELDYCPPCGVCRQVMREFCRDDFRIILVKSREEYKEHTLAELLPESFGPDMLGPSEI